MKELTIINLIQPQAKCVVCGQWDISKWGLAVYDGQIVPDDYKGEWGGAPCCERCFEAWRHGQIKPWMTFKQAYIVVHKMKLPTFPLPTPP